MNIYEQILIPAVEEYNRTFNQGGQVVASKEARLSGQGGTLDSLELVNFIVVVEQKIRAATGKEVRLVTDEALSMKASPFVSLKALEEFLQAALGADGKK